MTPKVVPIHRGHFYGVPAMMAGTGPDLTMDVKATATSYATAAAVIGSVAAFAAVSRGPNAFLRGAGAATLAVGAYGYFNRDDLKHLALVWAAQRGTREITRQIERLIP